MKFEFKDYPAYVLARKFFQLCLMHFEKIGFAEHKELKHLIEKLTLAMISNIVKLSTENSENEAQNIRRELLQNINELAILYDIVREIGLIQQKDIYTIETYLHEIAEELEVTEKDI